MFAEFGIITAGLEDDMADGGETKYRQIFEDLQRSIRDGMYPQGVSLPSDEALMRRYGVSRITVTFT